MLSNTRKNLSLVHLFQGTPTAGSSLIGINFRGTAIGPSGYVGDELGFTYLIASDIWNTTTPISRGAFTNLGWEGSNSLVDVTDSASLSRGAGRSSCTAGSQLVNIELPSIGMYNVWAMLGHQGATRLSGIRIRRGPSFGTDITPLAVTNTSTKIEDQYTDLTGAVHTSYAAFLSNAMPVQLDFTSNKIVSLGKHPDAPLDIISIWFQKITP